MWNVADVVVTVVSSTVTLDVEPLTSTVGSDAAGSADSTTDR